MMKVLCTLLASFVLIACSGIGSNKDSGSENSGNDTGNISPVPEFTMACGTPTHYVTPNASGIGTGTEADPWSITQAMQEASAGNIVEFAAGEYTGESTNNRWLPAFYPRNSGTSESPIVFCAAHPAAVTEDVSNYTVLSNGHPEEDNTGSPTYGCEAQNYVIWDGFFVDEEDSATHIDTGPVVMHLTTGCEIRRAVVAGDPSINPFDNHTSIRVEDANRVAIRDSKIFGNYASSNSYNGSAIETYDVYDFVIENNEIYNSDGGVFIKGAPEQIAHTITIRRNYFHNLSIGVALAATATNGVGASTGLFGSHVYQNILENVGDCLITRGYGQGHPQDIIISNNLCVNSTERGIYIKDGDTDSLTISNNIIVNARVCVDSSEEAVTNGINLDRNLYFSCTERFGMDAGGRSNNLVEWVNATSWDVNSLFSDPLFLNQAAGDYRLNSASLAVEAGVDILNLLGGGNSATINYGPFISLNQSDVIGVR